MLQTGPSNLAQTVELRAIRRHPPPFFGPVCLTNDVHVKVKTHRLWTFVSAAPFIIPHPIGRLAERRVPGGNDFKMPSSVPRPWRRLFFQFWDAKLVELFSLIVAPPTSAPPALGFLTALETQPATSSAASFSRITSSSCAGCGQQEVLPLWLKSTPVW